MASDALLDSAVPAPPAPTRSQVLVVTGPVGAGKSTLINALLLRRKAEERWAVLINDFGRTDVASLEDEGVSVQTLSGCACCSATPVVRTSLVKLFRRSKPALAIIELSTLGEPDGLAKLLNADFQSSATLRCIVAVLAVESHEKLMLGSEKYQPQLDQADVLVLVGGDQAQIAAISSWAAARPKLKTVFSLPAPETEGTGEQIAPSLKLPDELLERLLG